MLDQFVFHSLADGGLSGVGSCLVSGVCSGDVLCVFLIFLHQEIRVFIRRVEQLDERLGLATISSLFRFLYREKRRSASLTEGSLARMSCWR